MTTLIAAYNSDGCIGRCDAKCYNATAPECNCICGGRNHGAGLKQAMENTCELADEWMLTYRQLHRDITGFAIPARKLANTGHAEQLTLPLKETS